MTLTLATFLTAFAFLLPGIAFLSNSPKWQGALRAFPRSERAAYFFFGLATVWFLWKVWNLSPADNLFNMDFTRFRILLMGIFGATAVGSFLYVRDLLPIRGLAILLLLFAGEGLSAAFGLYDVPQRLVLVTLLYLVIVVAIIIGAAPYHMRNALQWLLAAPERGRATGIGMVLIGVVLGGVALSY
jgi:hypothetical protein